MGRYLIEGRGDGQNYGIYEGDTPEQALALMFADAGAQDQYIVRTAWIVTAVDE